MPYISCLMYICTTTHPLPCNYRYIIPGDSPAFSTSKDSQKNDCLMLLRVLTY